MLLYWLVRVRKSSGGGLSMGWLAGIFRRDGGEGAGAENKKGDVAAPAVAPAVNITS